jgi:hypothetical protein
MLPILVRRTNFFDEFIDRDEVREAISKRTERGPSSPLASSPVVEVEEVEQPLPQEDEKEEDEKEDTSLEEENDKKAEDLGKIDASLYEDVRLSVESVYQDIVDEYGVEDGTLRAALDDEAAEEFGYPQDGDNFFESYVDIDVLYIGGSPIGLWKGRVFPLEGTDELIEGLRAREEYADPSNPADSFSFGVDMGQYLGEDYEDDRRAMLDDSIYKVEQTQEYVLRNATKRLLLQIRRSKFFDAFIDKDVVKEIIRKRPGSGKMKGGKFFLSDLLDMLRGKRNLEY